MYTCDYSVQISECFTLCESLYSVNKKTEFLFFFFCNSIFHFFIIFYVPALKSFRSKAWRLGCLFLSILLLLFPWVHWPWESHVETALRTDRLFFEAPGMFGLTWTHSPWDKLAPNAINIINALPVDGSWSPRRRKSTESRFCFSTETKGRNVNARYCTLSPPSKLRQNDEFPRSQHSIDDSLSVRDCTVFRELSLIILVPKIHLVRYETPNDQAKSTLEEFNRSV